MTLLERDGRRQVMSRAGCEELAYVVDELDDES
jgi:hypothetical protein